MIIFDNVTLRYDNKAVLEDFNLHVSPKERLVILGASGSGKTTLLRMIAGFVPPTGGKILINGEIVSEGGKILVSPHQRGVNMVFQDLALWPHMDVADNIAFGLKMQGMGKKERDTKVAQMLSLVHLEGYDPKHIDQLSGGEQQRVALARALALSPKVLLMDEPLSSLDTSLNRHLRREIVRLQEALGFTLVYVTHNEEEGEEIATRIINMY